jgi:hypothetical protein
VTTGALVAPAAAAAAQAHASVALSGAAAAANRFIPGALRNQASSHIGDHIGSGIASLGKKHLPMFGNQWNAAGRAIATVQHVQSKAL